MYCFKCGKEISDESRFCQFCGAEIVFNSKEEKHANTDKKEIHHIKIAKKTVLTIIMLIIVAAIALFIYAYHTSWNAAAVYDFSTAKQWQVLPQIIELFDQNFPEYVDAGVKYEEGIFSPRSKAFDGVDYNIDDSQLSDEQRYEKAENLIRFEDYTLALDLIEPLAKENYKDSKTVMYELKKREATKLAEDKEYVDALNQLKTLVDEGYLPAEEEYNRVRDEAYNYAVEQYRAGKDLVVLFEKIGDYKRSKDYAYLSQEKILSLVSGLETVTDSDMQKIISLIGFEDAGKVLFYSGNKACRFMEGTFKGECGSITTNKEADSYTATINITDVPKGNWYYYKGKFYTNDVERFDIEALSKDKIQITLNTNNKTYTLTRQ